MPEPPKNDRNFSQKWAYSDIENEFGMWRSEYDITDSWTAYTGLGAQHAHEEGIYSAPKLLDKSGNAVVSRLDTNRISDSVSGMAGIRGNFTTGFVSHKVNVGYSAMTKTKRSRGKCRRRRIIRPPTSTTTPASICRTAPTSTAQAANTAIR